MINHGLINLNDESYFATYIKSNGSKSQDHGVERSTLEVFHGTGPESIPKTSSTKFAYKSVERGTKYLSAICSYW